MIIEHFCYAIARELEGSLMKEERIRMAKLAGEREKRKEKEKEKKKIKGKKTTTSQPNLTVLGQFRLKFTLNPTRALP